VDQNKLDEIANAERSLVAFRNEKPLKPFSHLFGQQWWGKWETVHMAFQRLGLPPGTAVLDVGAGTGWSSLFLAEAGYRPLGVDIAPANVEIAQAVAQRWGSPARFAEADMEALDLGETFGAALVFDALHHSERPREVVEGIARHLEPGGWILFGEPSWLHGISPGARRVAREKGWVENGIRVSALRGHCRAAGLGSFRRFHEGTRAYEGRLGPFAWQLVRLVSANAWVAPGTHVWLAARKPA
jgi:2-polyprenyl-3-methyl-5-hydroxy-6-metoxy-1,4-benzoquinol methylase